MKKLKKYIARFFAIFSTQYRIQVLDDDHFENKASFKLSALQIFIYFTTTLIVFVVLTIYLVAFTGLREYIPGYADQQSKQKIHDLIITTDSLEQKVEANEKYIVNLQNVFTGKITTSTPLKKDTSKNYTLIKNSHSKEDSMLREEVAREEQYNISTGKKEKSSGMTDVLFFSPVRGKVVQKFNAVKQAYGTGISTAKDESFKCILDGTVIMAAWTPDDQYVLAIQHNDQFVSIYKHNSALLKKEGDFVKAGEPLGFVAQSAGVIKEPYLVIELWYRGYPVDPEKFIVF